MRMTVQPQLRFQGIAVVRNGTSPVQINASKDTDDQPILEKLNLFLEGPGRLNPGNTSLTYRPDRKSLLTVQYLKNGIRATLTNQSISEAAGNYSGEELDIFLTYPTVAKSLHPTLEALHSKLKDTFNISPQEERESVYIFNRAVQDTFEWFRR